MKENIAVINKENKVYSFGQLSAVRKYLPDIQTIGRKLFGLVVPLSILAAWELITRLGMVKPLFLPPPTKVVLAFYDMLINQNLLVDFGVSIFTVIQGFLWGTVFGLLIGIFAGVSRTVEKLLGSTLNSIRQIPPLAWLPLIVLWVGIGNLAKTVIIAKAVFFPVFLNTLQGIRSVPKEYIEVGQVFEFGKLKLLRKVILPASLPAIFVGIRYGAGLSWAMIVAAEMLSGLRGLGYLLQRAQELLLPEQLFVVMAIIGLVGFFIDLILRKIENCLLRWKNET